jgi:hypothetical protein
MAKKQPKLSWTTFTRTARAHAPLFLSRENVQFVTLGLKEINGQITDQLAIKIYVREKYSTSELNDYEVLPNSVKALAARGKTLQENIPIDVVSLGKGKFTLLGLKGSEQFYIQSVNVNGTCAILDKYGFIYTNAHVAAKNDGGLIEPSVDVIYNYTIYSGRINKISALRPTGNRMDAAVIKLSQFNSDDSWKISGNRLIKWPIAKLSDGGSFEYFSGFDHVKLMMPERATHPISFMLDGAVYGFDGFYLLQIDSSTESQPIPGHSGSLLVKKGNEVWNPAGIVFGLAEFSSRSYVCVFSWEDVESWVNNS